MISCSASFESENQEVVEAKSPSPSSSGSYTPQSSRMSSASPYVARVRDTESPQMEDMQRLLTFQARQIVELERQLAQQVRSPPSHLGRVQIGQHTFAFRACSGFKSESSTGEHRATRCEHSRGRSTTPARSSRSSSTRRETKSPLAHRCPLPRHPKHVSGRRPLGNASQADHSRLFSTACRTRPSSCGASKGDDAFVVCEDMRPACTLWYGICSLVDATGLSSLG